MIHRWYLVLCSFNRKRSTTRHLCRLLMLTESGPIRFWTCMRLDKRNARKSSPLAAYHPHATTSKAGYNTWQNSLLTWRHRILGFELQAMPVWSAWRGGIIIGQDFCQNVVEKKWRRDVSCGEQMNEYYFPWQSDNEGDEITIFQSKRRTHLNILLGLWGGVSRYLIGYWPFSMQTSCKAKTIVQDHRVVKKRRYCSLSGLR